MSSKNDGNKIIALPNRQPAPAAAGAGERLSEPLKSVRDLTLKRIAELTNALFDNIDDALFDRAEHAQTNALQSEYFDGMREVRKKRQRVDRLMLDGVSQVFNDFALGKIQAPRVDAASNPASGLSLVEDHDLEESLAVAGTVAKAESRLSRHLYALNRRLSAIRGGVPVENATNPIGPAQLCEAFRVAMDEFELNLQVRIIIYKLFDRYVMSGLDALYDEVNAHLIHAGVLPQLRHHVTQSSSHTHSSPASNTPASAPQRSAQTYRETAEGPAAGSIETEIYQTLRSLLAMRHADVAAPPPLEMTAASLPSLAPTDLLSALQILQSQTLQAQARAAEAVPGTQQLDAQQLKRALMEQADKLHAGHKAHVTTMDEDTIDLVGMLFEFIVQDRDLPPQMQALLGRLQIPFLKAAILDRHLFTHKTHPARQLLDNMAQACIGKTDDADQPLYDKIKEIVEMILRDFDDDLGLLERANADFSNYMETTKRRADLAEKRTAETVQGREKLEYARQLAASEMQRRCEDKNLPALFDGLINGPLAQYLVLIALRQGETSVEWKQALSFAEALIWSTAPKTTEADRTRLNNLSPAMLTYLHQSLRKVGWQDEDVQKMEQELAAFYATLLKPVPESGVSIKVPANSSAARVNAKAADKSDAAAESAKPEASHLETNRRDRDADVSALLGMMEKIVVAAPAPAAASEPTKVDDIYVEQVKGLIVGTWVEFSNPDIGTRERAKLSWISPISSKYLFVDRKGLKVADKTVAMLAAELAAGRITLIEDSMPLFDRAMGAIVERLKSFQPNANSNDDKLSHAHAI